MSDRLTNLEIEDVLSSIRRLVSQEVRPASPEENAVPRLVLTSALRVQPGRESATLTLSDPIAPGPAPEFAPESAPLHDRVAEIEHLLPEQDFEPEAGDSFTASSVIDWPRPPSTEDTVEAPFIDVDAEVVEKTGFEPQESVSAFDEILDPEPQEDAFEDAPAQMLDEATLREIVRDVLREELQGPMGNRVTRNLRRLIRAEIARAFAQDQRH